MSESDEPVDDKRMTFTEHLGELRQRIIYSGVSFLVTFIACIVFGMRLIDIIAYPLRGAGIQWTTLGPLESFMLMFKIATYGALIFASPVILYQIAAFVFPGLKSSERRLVKVVIFGSGLLVLAGVATAYFGVLPLVVPYLMQYTPEWVEAQLRLSETVGFILKALIGFAIAFQFPMVALVLVYMELLTPQTLKSYRKLAIIGIAIASAVLTPPDPISMTIMMIPLLLLYEASILLAHVVVRRKRGAG